MQSYTARLIANVLGVGTPGSVEKLEERALLAFVMEGSQPAGESRSIPVLLDSDDLVTTKLLEWRDAGIQVALDDFGTGYSSLSYLQKFDIDFIKIDQSFVRDLQPKSTNFTLCKAMVAMAHALGLQVVAEGVETAVQRDLLLETGCDFAQGYFYARPMASDGLHAWVTDRNPGVKR